MCDKNNLSAIRNFLCIFSIVMSASSLKAVDILTYNFATLAPFTVDPNATASNVNFTGSSASQFTLPNVLAIDTATGAVDAATAVSNDSFYQFSITPNAGFSIDLSNLSFKGSTAASGTPNNGYVVRSSVDGYATNLSTSSFATQFSTFTTYNVSLTTGFQSLTTETTFRIYSWMDKGTNPSVVYDDIALAGTVTAVPEPCTYILGSLATGMIAIASRRRKRSA